MTTSGSGSPVGRSCPSCNEPLGHQQVRGVGLEACSKCDCMLVTQSTLMPLLEALSVDLLTTFNPDAELKALPNRAQAIGCPDCRKTMEKSDYCSAKIVFFDRCNPCSLLWFAGEELGAMSLMWARMEARIARTRAQNQENLAGMESLVDAGHLRRAVKGSIFRALPLGTLF
jgi:Zn-finger nucleic acid-binding protein